jgi:aromatic-L-amino-acid decarboxylase
MDTGVQLGRRFRALKLWMILRSYGARQLRAHLSRHIALARMFAEQVDNHPDFERLAPVPFSVVCFRWHPKQRHDSDESCDRANAELCDAVNATGEVLLSTTRVRGRLALRVAIGHLRTTEAHVQHAWELLQQHASTITESQ